MNYQRLTEFEIARRRRLARRTAAAGGNLHDFARELRISAPGALHFLRKHAPDLHSRLRSARSASVLPMGEVVRRLRLLKLVERGRMSLEAAARRRGVTASALLGFRARWAPDGIDQALADLAPLALRAREAAHG